MAFNNPAAELQEGAALTFAAVDHGLQAWTFDPASQPAGTYTLATGGTVYVVALKTNPRLITNIIVGVQTAGGTLTASQPASSALTASRSGSSRAAAARRASPRCPCRTGSTTSK